MHAFTLSRRSQPPHRCMSATFHWRPVYGRLINKSADGSDASSRSLQRARVYVHGKTDLTCRSQSSEVKRNRSNGVLESESSLEGCRRLCASQLAVFRWNSAGVKQAQRLKLRGERVRTAASGALRRICSLPAVDSAPQAGGRAASRAAAITHLRFDPTLGTNNPANLISAAAFHLGLLL